MVRRVKERFGIDRAIFVGDRGMISAQSLEEITKAGLGYIIAMRHEKAKKLLKERKVDPELFDKKVPITIYEEGKVKK